MKQVARKVSTAASHDGAPRTSTGAKGPPWRDTEVVLTFAHSVRPATSQTVGAAVAARSQERSMRKASQEAVLRKVVKREEVKREERRRKPVKRRHRPGEVRACAHAGLDTAVLCRGACLL